MRDIRFRGFTVNGIEAIGFLSKSGGETALHPEKGFYISNQAGGPWAYQVRPETVGQYTGLKDKNGAEIYEGDIVRIPITWGIYDKDNLTYGVGAIEFRSGQWLQVGSRHKWIIHQSENKVVDGTEVIGNIHEHKHLLEG